MIWTAQGKIQMLNTKSHEDLSRLGQDGWPTKGPVGSVRACQGFDELRRVSSQPTEGHRGLFEFVNVDRVH